MRKKVDRREEACKKT
jgi:hypothetical protein